MYSKVVLIVSRSHWRCVTCQVHHKRTVSIDQHLQSAHPHCAAPSSHITAGSLGNYTCCLSDGELDTTFPTVILPLKNLALETKINLLAEKEYQVQKLDVAQSPRQSHRRQKSTKKTFSAQASRNNQKPERESVVVTSSHISKLISRDFDQDNKSLNQNGGSNEHTSRAEEKRDKKMTQGKSQPAFKEKCAQPQVKHCVNNRRQKGNRKTPVAKTSPKELNNLSIANDSVRKRTDAVFTEAEKDGVDDPACVGVNKEKTLEDDCEIETSNAFEQEKHAELYKGSNKKLKQVDKSRFATCCVPWLLDSGRKAGEKVTKKTRRPLTPEEKWAVAELYGVHLYGQATETCAQSLVIPGQTGEQCSTESQSVNASQCRNSYHSSLTSVQRINREEDSTSQHKRYLVNMFSQETQDFYMDGLQAGGNPYTSYGPAYRQQQQQEQQSLYPSQRMDNYSPHHDTPSQRSNLINFQHDTHQVSQTVLSTPIVGVCSRAQIQVRAFFQQGASPSHPHAVITPAVRPLPVSDSSPALVATTDIMANGPQSAEPPAANCDIKSNPASLQGPHSESAVPHYAPQMTSNIGENPCNHCDVRKETFESGGESVENMSSVDTFDSVECKRCRTVLHGLHELNLHVFSLHEVEKQGFCFMCSKDIAGMENLERHIHKHAYGSEWGQGNMRFHDCRLCGQELSSCYPILRTHYYQHHMAHVCSECFQHFSDVQAYRDHSQTHSSKPFVCSICGTKFESPEDLDGHAPCPEDIWAEDGKGDQCRKCGVWCPNHAVVEAHRRQHRSQGDVQAYRQGAKVGFPCTSCEKVFRNKHACQRHIKVVHQGVPCYKHYCEYCGKGFLTKGHMQDHIALHHLHIRRYSCDYCSRQFVCAPTLRRHMRKEHTKHRPYQCQHCGERFFEKTPLQRHLTQHTGLAPFMCEHCGKGFYTKHSFSNHASTHSSVKDFVCTGCQKGFTRKYNLQAHEKICKML